MDWRKHERRREMEETWDSWRWVFKGRLEHMISQMTREMKAVGVPEKVMEQFLPDSFADLCMEIVREQNAAAKKKAR